MQAPEILKNAPHRSTNRDAQSSQLHRSFRHGRTFARIGASVALLPEESRSLLIQQLFQGGFKEDDDDDEDEDEAHELIKHQPSDERQGFGRKDQTLRGLNKGSKDDDATKTQVVSDLESHAANRHKLLNPKPWKESPKAELPGAGLGDCLQSEKEIIEKGSKKLLQIHSEFLVRPYPPLQHVKGPATAEPESTAAPKESNCFPKSCHDVHKQQLQRGEGLFPSLAAVAPKLVLSQYKEEHADAGAVGSEAPQQSYGSVEDALLSTQRDFTSPVSPEEDERRQRCFAVLKNAKVAARELHANISIPVFSTGFENNEKKLSISGCTESLASDRRSSTDSVNENDAEVHIQDVTSAEKSFSCDEFDVQNPGDHFDHVLLLSTDVEKTVEAIVCITDVEEVVAPIPAIQLETVQSGKNRESETTDSLINDRRIETIAEHEQAEKENPVSHVSEEHHAEFSSKVHDRAVEFKSSVSQQSTVNVLDEISTVPDSSRMAVDEIPGARHSRMFMNSRDHSALFVHLDIGEEEAAEEEEESEDYKCSAPTKKVECQAIISTTLHCSAVSPGAAEQMGEPESVKFGKDVTVDARVETEFQQQDHVPPALDNNLNSCNAVETRLTESPLKTSTDAAPMRTCLSEEILNGGDDPVVAGDDSVEDGKSLGKVFALEKDDDAFIVSESPMAAAQKEQWADAAHPDTVGSPGKETTVMFTLSKLPSPITIGEATETSLSEGPALHGSPPFRKTTLQADRQSLAVKPSEVAITRTTTSSPLPVETPMKLYHSPNGKAGASRHNKSKKKKKKARVQRQDARSTMVFNVLRSDTRVAYNNHHHGPHFANLDLVPQEMANVMKNPGSLYDFAVGGSQTQQSTQAAAFLHHRETDVHLMQAQTSAKDAMVAATSALAQSHREWSRMQTQAAHSRLTVLRESQITAIAASVAAAAIVAKSAVEAARAIQEASKEFLGQLDGPSQSNFGKSEMLGHGRQGNHVSEMTNCPPMQSPNPSKRNTAGRKRKNVKKGGSPPSQGELGRDKPKERTVRFMQKEVAKEDQKVVPGEGGRKKRTRHEIDQTTQPGVVNSQGSSHAELRDPGGGVFRCTTKGDSAGDHYEPDDFAEVMTEEVGLHGGWFAAKVLMKTDREAFVQYNELFRDDGCTPCRNLFPLSCFREEDAYGRTQEGDRRWMRPLHPFSKAWKRGRGSVLPQTWTVGNHVDVYSNGGWWEGIVAEIDQADESNIKIRFPDDKGMQEVKAWDVRPSLIWAGDDWRPWKEKATEGDDEPPSKRPKLDGDNNGKNEPVRKSSLKKLIEVCKPVSAPVSVPQRVSRSNSEAAARKNNNNASRAMSTMLNNNTRPRVPGGQFSTPANRGKQQTLRQPARQARGWGNLATTPTAKKPACTSAPSRASSLAAREGTVSTRLQLKTEAEKRKNLSKLVADSKVIQKGAKSVSTRSDTMKLKAKALQTKLLKALKKTSTRKFKLPRPNQKK